MNCEHIQKSWSSEISSSGLCGFCWKARCEKAEAELDAYKKRVESSESEFIDEHNARVKAEAAAAEMREALGHHYVSESDFETHLGFEEALQRHIHALSTDAGKGWLSPEEHSRQIEIVRSETEKRSMEACIVSKEIAKEQGWIPPEEVEKLKHERNKAAMVERNKWMPKLAIAVEALTEIATKHYVNEKIIAEEALSKLKEDK